MGGIIGIIGNSDAAPLLVDGLRRLEYRGYDSAGIATLVNGHIDRRRAEGVTAFAVAAQNLGAREGVQRVVIRVSGMRVAEREGGMLDDQVVG